MEQNKTGKYLKYAIGEIVLVVIGILIALSINNWNEERKDRIKENQALLDLKSEFEVNQTRLNNIMEIKKTQLKDAKDYLNIITNDTIPIIKKLQAETPGENNENWGVTNSTLNSLINTGGIDRIQNDSLKLLLTTWPIKIDRYKEYEKRLYDKIRDWGNYENTIILRPIVNEGDFNLNKGFPGHYYPENVLKIIDTQKLILINDIQHYNHIAKLGDILYVIIMVATGITQDSKIISELINKELKARKIDISE